MFDGEDGLEGLVIGLVVLAFMAMIFVFGRVSEGICMAQWIYNTE